MEETVLATRTFELDDQRSFAELSGDFNPMHVDPVRARRLLFGDVVVHGIHSALWALDRWLDTDDDPPGHLRRLKVEFPAPLTLGTTTRAVRVASDSPGAVRLEARGDGRVAARVHAEWEPTSGREAAGREAAGPAGDSAPTVAPGAGSWSREPRDRGVEELEGARGELELRVDPELLARLLPSLARRLDRRQTALLLATTRLVGMEAPGLHSLYTRLTLDFDADRLDEGHASASATGRGEAAGASRAEATRLVYRVRTAHPRTGLVRVELEHGRMRGEVQALVRPRPVGQLSAVEAAERVEAGEFDGVEALVVGGSRGLGEVAAKLLAAGGGRVTCTWARGREDAERVVREIREAGGRARTTELDVLEHGTGPPAASHLLYFASPRIRATDGGFDRAEFHRYCEFYVAGFLRVATRSGATRILYPSTVFIDDPPRGFESYAAAKHAGESVCEALRHGLDVQLVAPRLPRLKTDQTVGVVQVSVEDPADRLLGELRSLIRLDTGREPE